MLAVRSCTLLVIGSLLWVPARGQDKTFKLSATITGVAAGVTVHLTGDASKDDKTDDKGTVTYPELSKGNYTLTPDSIDYLFSPSSQPAKLTDTDATVAFTAVRVYKISGVVVDGNHVAQEKITLTLVSSTGFSRSATTDDKGAYHFDRVESGTYALTPSPSTTALVFNEPCTTVTIVDRDVGRDFVATPPNGTTRDISGQVTGAAPPGVEIRLSGRATGATLTGLDGRFACPNLLPGTYSVTPSAPKLAFTPASNSVAFTATDAAAPTSAFTAVATTCTPPMVSFRWLGTSTAYLTTNAVFAGAGNRSITVLGRGSKAGEEWRIIIPDVTAAFHCANQDGKECKEQVLPIRFDHVTWTPPRKGKENNYGATLLEDNGRVTVEFNGLQNCAGAVRVEGIVAFEQHHLSIDLGASFNLDPAGTFKSHPELAFNATSRWFGWLSGAVDIRSTQIDEIKSGSSEAQTPQTPFLSSGMTLDSAVRLMLNLEANRWPPVARQSMQPWLAVVLGGGLRTVPSPTTGALSITDVRDRWFAGLRVQVTGYNAGQPAEGFGDTRGYFEMVYARDEFWRGSEMNRLRAEGQIEVPSIGSQWLRLLVRLSMDRPMVNQKDKPSEVRLSILTAINPSTFGTLLGVSPTK